MATSFEQLIRPEKMSEAALIEILKSRCIDISNIKTLKKADLVEMFKRIALPMPQRHYNEEKYLGKKLNNLRLLKNISLATEEEEALYEMAISSQTHIASKSNCERLKQSSEDSGVITKRTHSITGTNGISENGLKRKVSDKEVAVNTENKKRQKITWP